MGTCVLCGKYVDCDIRNAYIICDDCISRYIYNRNSGKSVCYVCGREVPADRRHLHYCCSEHQHYGSLIRKRLQRVKKNSGEYGIYMGLTRYRRVVNHRQKRLDEVAARAKANGVSYGVQKMIDKGLLRLG